MTPSEAVDRLRDLTNAVERLDETDGIIEVSPQRMTIHLERVAFLRIFGGQPWFAPCAIEPLHVQVTVGGIRYVTTLTANDAGWIDWPPRQFPTTLPKLPTRAELQREGVAR